jgi:hypothetical protein
LVLEYWIQPHDFSYRIFAFEYYLLLHNISCNSDWSYVYKATPVDAALDSLNTAVNTAINDSSS